jgi:NADH:ubiquinone oxidoreductase subunit E
MERRDKKHEIGEGIAEEDLQRIQKIISENRGKTGALIRILEQTQEVIGYLPSKVLEFISRELRVTLSEVYGIVSFYHFFTMVPKGRYIIQVCLGTSCYVKGGPRILDSLEKDFGLEPGGITPDGKFSLETVRCLGCCGLSPVMAVGGNVHRRVKPREIKEILSSYT